MKFSLIIISLLAFQIASFGQQKPTGNEKFKAKAKAVMPSLVTSSFKGSEKYKIALSFGKMNIDAKGFGNADVGIKFGDNSISGNLKILADESCEFKIGSFKVSLSEKVDFKIGGKLNYNLASKTWNKITEAIKQYNANKPKVENYPKGIIELRKRYKNCKQCTKVLNDDGGIKLNDGSTKNKAILKERTTRQLLPKYLDLLLDPESDSELSKLWKESGYFINNKLIEYLDKMCECQNSCDCKRFNKWKDYFESELKSQAKESIKNSNIEEL